MLKKYLKIYRVFINNSVSYLAQYRKDTWMAFVLNLLWLGMIFTILEIIFGQTNDIIGWSKAEVYFLTIIWAMADEIFILLFADNIMILPNIVTEGKLDWVLTKPVNKLFLISMHRLNIRAFYLLLTEILILFWLVWHFDFAASIYHVILAIILILTGIMVNYSFLLMLNTLSFWFFRIDNVNQLYFSLNIVGKYPLTVVPKTIKIILFTAIPIAYQAYVPVATLTGRLPWYLVVYSLMFSMFVFIISILFWRFAVKRYSSASS